MENYNLLSDRQKECLRLVSQGYTSKQIGRFLAISDRTVDNHIAAALDHIPFSDRKDAARALTIEEARLSLPRQPPGLDEVPVLPAPDLATVDVWPMWLRRFVPPLGGLRNTLSAEEKAYAIVRVAVLGLSGVIILVIAAAMLLWLIR